MGTDDIYHKNKRVQIGNYGRSSGNKKEERETFLIVCEGKETEPNYFKAFPVNSDVIDLDVRGEGKNTLSLVQEAVRLQEEAIDRKQPYVQVWCVFDKDFFTNEQFNQAIQLCNTKRIRYEIPSTSFNSSSIVSIAPILGSKMRIL